MGNRFGGLAGTVALVAALALALGVVLTRGGDAFTFSVPKTNYEDEHGVLVQDGAVTDVWVSEADRANESYGYTPEIPATRTRGSSLTRVPSLATWAGLPDGTYRFDTRSVTWELGNTHTVEIKDGVVQNAPSPDLDLPAIDTNTWGAPGSNWVLYWVNDAAEPFAACYDETNAYDEEWCVVWSTA